ncbi:MAG: hypothetical protein RLZZ77_2366 [Bacteroidota bacterium]
MKKISLLAIFSLWSICLLAVPYNVTFRVDMNNYTGTFTTPEVNGTFNGWCGSCNAMTDVDGDNIWETTISLEQGTYQYKFSHDAWTGQESLTPGSLCTLTSNGFTNRVINLTSDTVLDPVCWASCTSCAETLPSYNVTFRVDMNQYTGTFTTPEVNGTFNGWCGNCNAMTDTDGDNIWETTLSLTQGMYEYKFAHDAWGGQENLTQGLPCTMTTDGFTNRTLNLTSDVVLEAVCWGSCTSCSTSLPSHNVTFRVDMSQYTGTFTTPEVNGTFNGWCGNCNAMSDADGDNIWEVTLSLLEGTYEYKFAHDAWTGQENLTEGSSCTVTNNGFTNRSLNLTSDVVLDAVCWESCSACATVVNNYDVTFRVDMSQYTGTFTAPEVNGTFNGWCGNCNAMSDADGDNIWEVTLNLPEGSYEYKFAHDAWTGQENLISGSSCTITNNDGFTNRSLNLNGDVVLDAVCWGSCTACGTVVNNYDVTFRVDMSQYTGTFTAPEVNGTFNGWCGNCNAMSDEDGDNIWEVTLNLAEGSYEYKFAHDAWTNSENLTSGSSCTVTNNGFTNRSLNLTGDVVLDAVCWGSCNACSVQPSTYNVTFQVDMSQQTFSFTEMQLNGTFNNWCGACAPMSDANGDNIWEITIPLEAGSYEFKYAYDNWTGSEQLADGQSCTVNNGGFVNRALVVDGDMTLPVVCYASCAACSNPSDLFNVTFQVDMSNVTDAFTTPEVNGTFNNWCGACAPMTDANGDNIWEITIPLAAGNYEYKFAYDNWAGQETLLPGGSCTLTTGAFTNRVYTVSADVTLPVVCWGSCSACGSNEGPFAVTFRVDMQNVTDVFTTPEVNGTFNNWCGGCAPMSDTDGDDVWEITIPLPAGTHEFKYAYDAWTGQETLTSGSSCTITTDGFTNRVITVSEDMTMDVVCWASCAACGPDGVENVNAPIISMYPNPANTEIFFAGLRAGEQPLLTLYNQLGQQVITQKITNGRIDISSLTEGVYTTTILLDGVQTVQKVVIAH